MMFSSPAYVGDVEAKGSTEGCGGVGERTGELGEKVCEDKTNRVIGRKMPISHFILAFDYKVKYLWN